MPKLYLISIILSSPGPCLDCFRTETAPLETAESSVLTHGLGCVKIESKLPHYRSLPNCGLHCDCLCWKLSPQC